MQGPLSDVRVLDFTWAQAGPLATLLLCDMGAEVVKVESPRGDIARGVAPFPGGMSSVFTALNRGKKSIEVDLRDDEGREIVHRLAGDADVVVENFTPGTMARLGVGPDDLLPLNDRLIYASCSGFGSEAGVGIPAFDLVIQAMSGVMMVTGEPGSGPVRVGFSSADFGGGIFTALAILQALYERERTGRGSRVETSMMDAQIAMLWDVYNEFDLTGHAPEKLGGRHAPAAPFQSFATRDGHVVVAVVTDEQFADLCGALGVPGLAEDARFVTNTDRVANVEALDTALSERFRVQETDAVLSRLQEAGVPAGPVHDVAAAVREPFVQDMTMDMGAHGRVIGTPLKREGERLWRRERAPEKGEHTDEIVGRPGRSS